MVSKPSFWRDQGIIAAVLTAIAIAVGFWLDKTKSSVGTGMMVASVAIVISLYIVISYIAYRAVHIYVLREVEQRVIPNLDALRLAIESLKATIGQQWLISREELLAIEKKASVDEIWIVSQSLEEETDPLFAKIVARNLKRGIKYKYIVSDQPSVRTRTEEMKSAFRSDGGLQFVFVSDELFALVAPQDIAIYGPVGKNADRCEGYMNVPIGTGGNEYFIRLAPKYVRELIGRLRARVDSAAIE